MGKNELTKLLRDVTDSEKIVTPALRKWLTVHGDDALPEAVAERMYQLLIQSPADRSGAFRASSAGLCFRRQELAFLGIPQVGKPNATLQNLFNDGKWRHLRWQSMLLVIGVLDDIEVGKQRKKLRAVGTMDGEGTVAQDHSKLHWRGTVFGFELKGVSPYQYGFHVSNGPKDEHLDQVHRYFYLSGNRLFVIVYENKATQEWVEWVIEADPQRLADQKYELRELNSAIDQKRLHPMLDDCRRGVGTTFRECPFGGKGGPCAMAGKWPKGQSSGTSRLVKVSRRSRP